MPHRAPCPSARRRPVLPVGARLRRALVGVVRGVPSCRERSDSVDPSYADFISQRRAVILERMETVLALSGRTVDDVAVVAVS